MTGVSEPPLAPVKKSELEREGWVFTPVAGNRAIIQRGSKIHVYRGSGDGAGVVDFTNSSEIDKKTIHRFLNPGRVNRYG